MSYTPTTTNVRKAYVRDKLPYAPGGSVAEFNRFLEAVRAEAKAEALREAADLLAPKGILWWGDSGVRVSDGPFDMPQGSLDDWLRARADRLVTDE